MRTFFLEGMRAKGVVTTEERSLGAVTKTWDKIKKGTGAFASSILGVTRMNLTGSPSEAAVIRGALAHSKGHNTYEAIRDEQARMNGTEKKGTKRKKYSLERFVGTWKFLRKSDKWSSAAGAAAAGMAATGTGSDKDEDSEEESASGSASKAVSVRGFQSRPIGNKAAKKAQMQDLADARELRSSTEALNAIAQASAERSAIILFNLPSMRDSDEAKLFMRAKARELLVKAGVAVAQDPAVTKKPTVTPQMAVIEIDDGVLPAAPLAAIAAAAEDADFSGTSPTDQAAPRVTEPAEHKDLGAVPASLTDKAAPLATEAAEDEDLSVVPASPTGKETLAGGPDEVGTDAHIGRARTVRRPPRLEDITLYCGEDLPIRRRGRRGAGPTSAARKAQAAKAHMTKAAAVAAALEQPLATTLPLDAVGSSSTDTTTGLSSPPQLTHLSSELSSSDSSDNDH